jgi:uncharacterized protein with FMN-binding domain
MKNLRILLFITTIASVIAGYAVELYRPEKKIDEQKYLQEISPGSTFTKKQADPPHYRSQEGNVAYNSYDIYPSIRGYSGPIKVLLTMTADGKISGIRLLEHKETKNYVHYMETPEYLRQFIGKSISDPFEIDRDIDSISRATVSVEALARTVRDSSRTVASRVLNLDVQQKDSSKGIGSSWVLYLIIFAISFAMYFISRRSEKYLRFRDFIMLLSIGITGLYLSSPFSILHVFNLVLLRPSSSALWLAITASTVISIIIAGRFYCGWLCPLGAISEFIGRLPLKKWDIPENDESRGRNIKYVILGLAAIIVFITRRAEFGNYETYVTLFSFHGSLLAWSLVFITLLANVRIKRFWCRYLCPVAALTGLFCRKEKGYPSSPECPIGNRPMPLISECIRCNRCYKRQTAETTMKSIKSHD